MIKIFYCIRPNYENGGDGIQALKTKKYIENNNSNISITIITNPDDINDYCDLVHIFNYSTSDISRRFFERAKQMNIKIVSSPIYWDYSYSFDPLPLYFRFNKNFIEEKYVLLWRKLNYLLPLFLNKKLKILYHNISRSFKKDIRYFVENSSLILPNSTEESDKCMEFAGINKQVYKDKIRVVFNGVDLSNIKIIPKNIFFHKYEIPENYILQVGRVSFLKNQINLISAMFNHPEIPIVILGNCNAKDKYVSKIKELGEKRGNVFVINSVPHDDVYSFYYYAKTHVLLSFRESPGLVSIEALSQNCPIVISDDRFLPVKSYFSKQCEVVNPFDKIGIEHAIMKSYKKEHIKIDLSKFSWNRVAEDTYNAYMELLNSK